MQTETLEAAFINEWLKTQPKHLNGKYLFRLSWTSDQFEVRTGTYCLYYGAQFIKEEKKTERVNKYPYFADRWILERYFPPEQVQNPELPEACREGSYEPLYLFEGADGRPLPLNLQVVKIIVHRCLNPSSKQAIKDAIAEEMLEQEKVSDYADGELIGSITSSPMESLLHFGEGVSLHTKNNN